MNSKGDIHLRRRGSILHWNIQVFEEFVKMTRIISKDIDVRWTGGNNRRGRCPLSAVCRKEINNKRIAKVLRHILFSEKKTTKSSIIIKITSS
jgi:hypothetical protein